MLGVQRGKVFRNIVAMVKKTNKKQKIHLSSVGNRKGAAVSSSKSPTFCHCDLLSMRTLSFYNNVIRPFFRGESPE